MCNCSWSIVCGCAIHNWLKSNWFRQNNAADVVYLFIHLVFFSDPFHRSNVSERDELMKFSSYEQIITMMEPCNNKRKMKKKSHGKEFRSCFWRRMSRRAHRRKKFVMKHKAESAKRKKNATSDSYVTEIAPKSKSEQRENTTTRTNNDSNGINLIEISDSTSLIF